MVRKAFLTPLAALALAGCGASSTATVSGASALFSRHCSVCHTIGTKASRSQMGGDLAGWSLPRSELAEYIAEMPKHRGALSRSDVNELVSYVASFERHRGRHQTPSVG